MNKKDLDRIICATLPYADPDDLIDLTQNTLNVLSKYMRPDFLSRDTAPSHPVFLARVATVENLLRKALAEIQKDGTEFTIHRLSGQLDAPPALSTAFYDRLTQLHLATQRTLEEFQDPTTMTIDGEVHLRRTRTHRRDKYLIPELARLLVGYDYINPSDPLDIDSCCSFVGSVLDAAKIPRPSSGDTSHGGGESGQGRLRRQIKDALRALDE